MRRLCLLPLVAVLALPACGGGDSEEDAEGVVKDFATAVSESDGKTFCNDLITRDFLEKTTGATGDNAEKQCEQQINQLKGQTYKVVKIEKTEIDGDKATVTAQIETQGRKDSQVFRLEKEDGDFRLTGAQP